jgi:pimeloyl-ACP methyl ester carboxylesterase
MCCSGRPPDDADDIRRRMGDESTLAALQTLAPHRTRDIRCPLLVLAGDQDRIVPPHATTRTARTHGTRAHLFRGMGHLLMLEPQAAAPLRFVLDWLDRTVGTEHDQS